MYFYLKIPLRSQFGQYPIKLKDMVLNTDTLGKAVLEMKIWIY
jgi:hypothetical protein